MPTIFCLYCGKDLEKFQYKGSQYCPCGQQIEWQAFSKSTSNKVTQNIHPTSSKNLGSTIAPILIEGSDTDLILSQVC